MPGKMAALTFLAISSSWVRIMPSRLPRRVLWVVAVATWACAKGEGQSPATTSPAKCAMPKSSGVPMPSAIWSSPGPGPPSRRGSRWSRWRSARSRGAAGRAPFNRAEKPGVAAGERFGDETGLAVWGVDGRVRRSAGPSQTGGDAVHGLHEGDGGPCPRFAPCPAEKRYLKPVDPVELRSQRLETFAHHRKTGARRHGVGQRGDRRDRGGVVVADPAEGRLADAVIRDKLGIERGDLHVGEHQRLLNLVHHQAEQRVPGEHPGQQPVRGRPPHSPEGPYRGPEAEPAGDHVPVPRPGEDPGNG